MGLHEGWPVRGLPICSWVKTFLFSFASVSIYDIQILYRMVKINICKTNQFSELVAQLVRVSLSKLCPARRHRFEPRSTLDIYPYHLPWTVGILSVYSWFFHSCPSRHVSIRSKRQGEEIRQNQLIFAINKTFFKPQLCSLYNLFCYTLNIL